MNVDQQPLVEVLTARVYRGGGRRYFNRDAAIRRAARVSVQTEMGHQPGTNWTDCDCPFHCLEGEEQLRRVEQRRQEIERSMRRKP